MDSVILDTDIIIDYSRGISTELQHFLNLQDKGEIILIVPAMVIFEFYSGSSLTSNQAKELADLLFSKFKIVEFDETIAKIAAQINRERKMQEKIDVGDIIIAATCLYYKAKIATKNKKHFKQIKGLTFFLPRASS